jgi:hypothetical protein
MKVRELRALLNDHPEDFPDDFDVLARNVEQMENHVTEVVRFGSHSILLDASDGDEYDEYERDHDEPEGPPISNWSPGYHELFSDNKPE